jgi:hypothetical protein
MIKIFCSKSSQQLTWMPRALLVACAVVWAVASPFEGARAESSGAGIVPWLELAGGPVWQSRNDVEIPYEEGTRFSLSRVEPGPLPSFRVYAGLRIGSDHEVMALYAPLVIQKSATKDKDILFREELFVSKKEIDFYYKFNSYRLGYRYSLWQTSKWTVKLGFTAKVRDARVRLEQGDTSAELDNVGFVPLIHFFVAYDFAPRWQVELAGDALASPYGRAEDVALKLNYQISDRWLISGGYRTVEGGSAGSGDVYTFAWLHYAELSLRYTF